MKIAVAGLGYVGLSMAVLLAQNNEVVAIDVISEKVKMINEKKSPINDIEIQDYLQNKPLNLYATVDPESTYKNASYVIIATPTNYNPVTNYFVTDSIENVIKQVLIYNQNATIVIKSTIPLGYVKQLRVTFDYPNIIFSPEFLREGKALYDNLFPSRIIVGGDTDRAVGFAKLLQEAALKPKIPVLFTQSDEAEAIKLFSNTYLAMRVSFFNELDTYAELKGLDSKQIINGVSLDPRIGNHYNNPSFGYGGYCLPKDTKQLLADYKGIPQKIMSAIVESNKIRKDHIASMISKAHPKTVGFFKLVMKANSDNFRQSAILGIMKRIQNMGIDVIVFEPLIHDDEIYNYRIINDIKEFKRISDVIVTNRYSDELNDVLNKIYTRDLFTRD